MLQSWAIFIIAVIMCTITMQKCPNQAQILAQAVCLKLTQLRKAWIYIVDSCLIVKDGTKLWELLKSKEGCRLVSHTPITTVQIVKIFWWIIEEILGHIYHYLVANWLERAKLLLVILTKANYYLYAHWCQWLICNYLNIIFSPS